MAAPHIQSRDHGNDRPFLMGGAERGRMCLRLPAGGRCPEPGCVGAGASLAGAVGLREATLPPAVGVCLSTLWAVIVTAT